MSRPSGSLPTHINTMEKIYPKSVFFPPKPRACDQCPNLGGGEGGGLLPIPWCRFKPKSVSLGQRFRMGKGVTCKGREQAGGPRWGGGSWGWGLHRFPQRPQRHLLHVWRGRFRGEAFGGVAFRPKGPQSLWIRRGFHRREPRARLRFWQGFCTYGRALNWTHRAALCCC